MAEINFNLQGINQYLRKNGLRSIKSLWANENGGNSRYALGNASVSIDGADKMSKDIVRMRNGQKVEERFDGNLLMTLPYKIEGCLRKVHKKPNLTQMANTITDDPLRAAVTAIATHEIGHGQRDQMIPNFIMLSGFVLLNVGTMGICETSWTPLLEDIKTIITGGFLFYTGRILQEYFANNFAFKHGSQIAKFVNVGSEEL